MRRRTDVVFALLVSAVLHGTVLAAAGSFLLQRASFEEPEPRPPLEIVLVEREAFESELAPDPLSLPAEPVRTPKVHRPPELPEWPVLEVERTVPSPRVLRLPMRREELAEPEQRSQPEVEHPPATPLAEESVEPPEEAEPVRTASEAAGPVPIGPVPIGPVPIGDASELVLYRPELRYPARALRRGVEGVTHVGLDVGPSGAVARAWILSSSGNRSLDRAALAYVQGFVFDVAAVAAAGRGNSFSKTVRFVIE